jgi:transposase
MHRTYTLGMDVAKRKVTYELLDVQRRTCATGTASLDQQGWQQLLKMLASHGHPDGILVVIEATGVLHLPWADALTRRGHPVLVLNPLMSKRLYTTANAIRDNKTDRVDAHSLAEIGLERGDQLQRFRYQPQPMHFGLQRLETVRTAVRHALTNVKKTYASLLEVVFPELSALVSVQRQDVRALLAKAPTPAALSRLHQSTLRACFGAKTDVVLAAARASLTPLDLAHATTAALQAVLETIEQLESRLRQIDAQMQALLAAAVSPRHIALTRSLPGVGAKTAASILAHLPPDMLAGRSRKKVAARLQALMGNDPRVQESGQWIGTTRMSKRGNRALRIAFFQAAFCAIVHDEHLRAFYQRKRAEGKHHKVAISHVMRILARRLVAVLMSEKPYEVCCAPVT